ncbi:MAG: hypothetical protein IRZ07_28310 [Microbispora sp.]|nr:hypothetical protein [Microbispora sp.]
MSELPPPLAVLDSRCEDWPPPNLSDVMGWLRSNGINTKVTYRVELYLVDTLFAKVFQYQRDEHGRMICNVDHDHRNNPDQCEAARREPYLLPLNNMPPTPNGGDQ